VTVDKDFAANDENIELEQFNGGHYAVMKTKFKYNGGAWGEFIYWISKNSEYSIGDWWFFEEYMIDKPVIEMDTEMLLHMPVKLRV
jgi:AraC family transcriptional regulator